jgi:thioredoxin reductase (NADPH)
MKTLIVSPDKGGTVTKGHVIENYLSYKSVPGLDLAKKMVEHTEAHETVEWHNGTVDKVEKKGEGFIVHSGENSFESRTLFMGMGMQHKDLGVKGEEDFVGKGVSYCYNCDAPLFRKKVVAVVGGGDSAVNGAVLLSQYADKVYLLVRSKIRAEPANAERLNSIDKVEVMLGEEVEEIIGEGLVSGVKLKSGKSLDVQGLFVEIGYVPSIELIKELDLKINKWNFIEVNDARETSVKGVFAGGDIVAQNTIKQIISAVADGSTAAIAAHKYITTKEVGGKLR